MVRRWFGGVADRLDRIRGVVEETQVPPRRLVLAVGSSSREEFLREGVHIEGLLRSELELRPEDDLLDIGCGAGRLAIALSGFLKGRYEGRDVMAPAIDWCRSAITPEHSRGLPRPEKDRRTWLRLDRTDR